VRTPDRLLAFLGTPLLAAAVACGSASTLTPPRPAPSEPAGGAGPGTIDLPEGVRLDPETLTLVGMDLVPFPGTEVVTWETLAKYVYQEGLEGVPEEIRALDGKRVTMAGFLLTLYEFDDIEDFNLVASHWSCCFGVVPSLNGWVHVKLAEGQVGLPNTSEPLKVAGTFRLREEKEAGYVVSIYALEDAEAKIVGW
jgi:hypothetical protein